MLERIGREIESIQAIGKAGELTPEFRQRGLLAAIGSIGVLALAIALKLRELGRRRKGQ